MPYEKRAMHQVGGSDWMENRKRVRRSNKVGPQRARIGLCEPPQTDQYVLCFYRSCEQRLRQEFVDYQYKLWHVTTATLAAMARWPRCSHLAIALIVAIYLAVMQKW